MKGETGMGAAFGGAGPDCAATGAIIPWPGTLDLADGFQEAPLLDGLRAWALAAMAGRCPLWALSGRLVAEGRAGWVIPLDRFMRALCHAAARPLRIAPPAYPERLIDETRLLTALRAIRQRRTDVARAQLCALASPDCIDRLLHAALLLESALREDPKQNRRSG